jgi:hypothetical protein
MLSCAAVIMPAQASPAAQFGGAISYGTSLIASLGDGFASAVYSFDGTAGDLITARAIGIGGGLSMSLALAGPNQEPLFSTEDDLFSPQDGDAALAYYLPQTATYTLIVNSIGGTSGQYLLQLRGQEQGTPAQIPFNGSGRVNVSRSGAPQYLTFSSTPDCPTTLTITNQTAGAPFTFPYVARVRDVNGQLVGQVIGGRQIENRISFYPGSGSYIVEVFAVSSQALSDGELLIASTCYAQQPSCEVPVLAPVVPPTPTPTPTPSSGQLALISQGGTLQPFEAQINVIGEGSPQVLYTFNGTAGDLANLQVIGISQDFDPQVTVLTPSGALLGTSVDNQFSFNVTDAAVTAYLPETGIYSALVSGEGALGGTFVIRVTTRPPVFAQEIGFSETIELEAPPPDASIARPNPPQYFTFEANSDCPTTLVFNNLTEGEPYTFPFVFTVRDSEGITIAQMIGGRQTENRIVVAANSGTYEVEILAARPDARGQLEYRTTCAGEALFCDQFGVLPEVEIQPTPTRTPSPSAVPTVPISTPVIRPTATPPAGDLCAGFRLTSPTDGMPNGLTTFFWDPAAIPLNYQVQILDGGNVLATFDAGPNTSVTGDVSQGIIGGAFALTIRVIGFTDRGLLCTSEVTVFREAPTSVDFPTSTPETTPESTVDPVCGDPFVCEDSSQCGVCPECAKEPFCLA